MSNIVIDRLTKVYGDNAVLKDFSVAFAEGETTCLMGKSGWGKTTLFNILMGFEKADSGQFAVCPAKKAPFFRKIGYARSLLLCPISKW